MYKKSINFQPNMNIEVNNHMNYQVTYSNFVLVQKKAISPPNTSLDSSLLSTSSQSPPSQPRDCKPAVPVRSRIAFTLDQIDYLEYEFQKCILLKKYRRSAIAKHLGLQERHVKVWFQNRRIKLKKETINGKKQKSAQLNPPPLPEVVPHSSNIEEGSQACKIVNNSSFTVPKVAQNALLRVRTVEEINKAIGLGQIL